MRRSFLHTQGITCNLLDLTFKHHLHKMHPSPAAYSAFLGETAMWTGVVTGGWLVGGRAGACAFRPLLVAALSGPARPLPAHARAQARPTR